MSESDPEEVSIPPGAWNVTSHVDFLVRGGQDTNGRNKYKLESFTAPYNGDIQALKSALNIFLLLRTTDDIVGMALELDNTSYTFNTSNYVYQVLGDFTKTKLKNIKFLYIKINVDSSVCSNLPCNSKWGVPNCFNLSNLEFIESWVPLPMLSNTIKRNNCRKLKTIFCNPGSLVFDKPWENFWDVSLTPQTFECWSGFVPWWALPEFGQKLNVVQTLDLTKNTNIPKRRACLKRLCNPLLKVKGVEVSSEWVQENKKPFCNLLQSQCNTLEYIIAGPEVIKCILRERNKVRFPRLKTIYFKGILDSKNNRKRIRKHKELKNIFPIAELQEVSDLDDYAKLFKNSVLDNCPQVLWHIPAN